MEIQKLTAAQFEEAVKEGIVLLDFFADWCMPCQMLMPTIHAVAEERQDVKVYRINVDEEPALAAQFRVMSIPALFVLKDGAVVNRSVGVIPREQLDEMLQEVL